MVTIKGSGTKGEYEEYLNNLSPVVGSEEWVIGGKERSYYMFRRLYGRAIRKYDVIAFECGYRDWKDSINVGR